MAQNLSKTVKVKFVMTSSFSVEYQKLLETVYIQIGAASLSFIQSYSNLAKTFNTGIALGQTVGFKIIDVSLVLMMSSS